MHRFVFHNDRLIPLNEVRLSPGQAGLFNGWGLFTTLRLYGGRAFAFERHWRRLTTDARRTQLPFGFSAEAVCRNLNELIQANQVKDGCARIYMIYNKIGFWASDEPFPVVDLIMYTTDLLIRQGSTTLGVLPFGRLAASPLAGTKVTSWLHNVWSLEQAHQRGFDEIILLNERGEVAECTAANVFAVRGGVVETPPLSSGCLAGVTREVVLELSREMNLLILERSLTLADVYRAEEVFVTSTTREVQPVRQVEQFQIPLSPGPVTARLAEAFSHYVTRYFAS